jgi:hypothetical protein
VNDEPGGLVDGQEVVVLEEHVEVQVAALCQRGAAEGLYVRRN